MILADDLTGKSFGTTKNINQISEGDISQIVNHPYWVLANITAIREHMITALSEFDSTLFFYNAS